MISPPERSRFSRIRSGKTLSPVTTSCNRTRMSPVNSSARLSARSISTERVPSASWSPSIASRAIGTSDRTSVSSAMMS